MTLPDEVRFGRCESVTTDGQPNFPSVTVEVWASDLTQPGIEERIVLMAKQALAEASQQRVKSNA